MIYSLILNTLANMVIFKAKINRNKNCIHYWMKFEIAEQIEQRAEELF